MSESTHRNLQAAVEYLTNVEHFTIEKSRAIDKDREAGFQRDVIKDRRETGMGLTLYGYADGDWHIRFTWFEWRLRDGMDRIIKRLESMKGFQNETI